MEILRGKPNFWWEHGLVHYYTVDFLGRAIDRGSPGCSPISWTAETVENFLPPFSVSETEITKVLSQYSSVMVCVGTRVYHEFMVQSRGGRSSVVMAALEHSKNMRTELMWRWQ